MKSLVKFALACVPLALVAACGGGDDAADRLDLADPAVRFVNASQTSGNLTLNTAGVARGDATNTPYPFASNYDFGINTSAADWTITTAAGNLPVGTKVNIDPKRGTRYTLVAMDSAPGATNLYRIDDPYNVPVGSSSAHLRVVNASATAGTVDVYMTTGLNADISTAAPKIAAIAINTAGPASGSDSVDIPGDTTYQVRVFPTGQRTNPLFSGQLTIEKGKDVLIVTVPTVGGISALVKVEGGPPVATIPTL
ncbi:MAG: DUF4397 domain-containing protein [Burkholderiaceae bacterium]